MNKFKSYIIITILILFTVSCNEEEWLEERPLDFYSPANSFQNAEDFNSSIARLYENVDETFYDGSRTQRAMHYPTDILSDAIAKTHRLNLYEDRLVPNAPEVQNIWSSLYQIVFNANTVLNRIDGENVDFSSEDTKTQLKAEARFFRGFAYRTLGILYGGVPIVLEEISGPKRDFVRSSSEETFNQAISDVEFATQNLPEVTNRPADGRLCQAAAYHLLSELYIIQEEWDNAIDAASSVIDNPNFSLMTERFGSRSDEPGDVYWDLFRRNNQNRSSGNTEAIWVNQYEYNVDGGGTSVNWPRFLVPLYWQLKDPDGVNLFIGPTTQHGGRGIGWYAPNPYYRNQIWQGDFDNDMRNSEHNIIRDIKANNPDSDYYGEYIVESGAIDEFPNNNGRWWTMIITKYVPINNFPEEFIRDPETGLTTNSANNFYSDDYVFRLAGTYLLRAEAYLGKGETGKAAGDINKVRERANATPVNAGEVDLDYILDERARELALEELRLLTLLRTNKLVERVKKYNYMTEDNIGDHQNLWPIPSRAIETNTEATLEQNPGYAGAN